MNIEIINKLDEIIDIIENDQDNKSIIKLKKEIENDKELLEKIKKVKMIDKYNSDYVELKKEILEDNKYREYRNKENDLYLIVQEINKRLKMLENKGGCK